MTEVISRWRPPVALALLVALLTGCASSTHAPVRDTGSEAEPATGGRPAGEAPGSNESRGRQPSPIPVKTVPLEHTDALQDILQQARDLYRRGQWSAAIAAAERGLRIERRSAPFYLVLAECYLQLGADDRAAEFARQGMRYTHQGDGLWRAFQQILTTEMAE